MISTSGAVVIGGGGAAGVEVDGGRVAVAVDDDGGGATTVGREAGITEAVDLSITGTVVSAASGTGAGTGATRTGVGAALIGATTIVPSAAAGAGADGVAGERVISHPPKATAATTAAAMPPYRTVRPEDLPRALAPCRVDPSAPSGAVGRDVLDDADISGSGLSNPGEAATDGNGRTIKSGVGTGAVTTAATMGILSAAVTGSAGTAAGGEGLSGSRAGRGAGRGIIDPLKMPLPAAGRDGARGGSGKGGRRPPFGRGPARKTVAGGRPQTTVRRNGSGVPFRGLLDSVDILTPAPGQARFVNPVLRSRSIGKVFAEMARFVTLPPEA